LLGFCLSAFPHFPIFPNPFPFSYSIFFGALGKGRKNYKLKKGGDRKKKRVGKENCNRMNERTFPALGKVRKVAKIKKKEQE